MRLSALLGLCCIVFIVAQDVAWDFGFRIPYLSGRTVHNIVMILGFMSCGVWLSERFNAISQALIFIFDKLNDKYDAAIRDGALAFDREQARGRTRPGAQCRRALARHCSSD